MTRTKTNSEEQQAVGRKQQAPKPDGNSALLLLTALLLA